MDFEVFRDFCLSLKGVTEGMPFGPTVVVFKVCDKMFALLPMDIENAQANLKCDPERAIELRDKYPELILPGYHMSKVHWNTVLVHALPDSMCRELIQHSYELVVASFSKKQKELYGSL
jgi:predicted DNA-binding protein (MmcQ/YjbR family)